MEYGELKIFCERTDEHIVTNKPTRIYLMISKIEQAKYHTV
jgi:hypothetical protein